MCTEEREAVLVILDLLNGNLPAEHRVTLGTIRSHLPPMDIGVAIGATLAYIRKNGFHVTLRAWHFFMHAAQGIVCFIVIELGDGSNGAPARGDVTVFARDCQRTVRTSSSSSLREQTRSEKG